MTISREVKTAAGCRGEGTESAVSGASALHHPGLHIALLGVVVAAVILATLGAPTGEEERRVEITSADLLQLRAGFLRRLQREPTPSELRGLLEAHVRAEVLYREALERGYDRDDPVVRQAMQRKMEFLASAQATQEPPTESEVEAFFELRRERYRLPAVLDLVQVYVSTDVRGDTAESAAAELLERLRGEAPELSELSEWGDPTLLQPVHLGQTEESVAAVFGTDFAGAVLEAEPGAWVGPIRSSYGWHLVKVLQREDARLPEWKEVAGRVLSDMEYEAGKAAKEQLFQEIAQGYQILLDPTVQELLEAPGE